MSTRSASGRRQGFEGDDAQDFLQRRDSRLQLFEGVFL